MQEHQKTIKQLHYGDSVQCLRTSSPQVVSKASTVNETLSAVLCLIPTCRGRPMRIPLPGQHHVWTVMQRDSCTAQEYDRAI